MPKFSATLGDGFPVVISYDYDADGDVTDLSVYTESGICLDDLIYATQLHDRALALAESNMQPPIKPTPYAGVHQWGARV